MSNCSDANLEMQSRAIDAKPGGVVGLLAAVSAEVASIASDITALGDSLADFAAGEPVAPYSDMQMFDLIGQNAQAQARLLAELVRCIADGERTETGSLRIAIGDIPFHNTRQRLYAALDGDAAASASCPSDEDGQDTDWF